MTRSKDKTAKEFYNSSDLYFDICENRDESSFKNLLDVVNQYVPKDSRLLEFGCGTGNLASMISNSSYRVTGVDISERFIKYAKETYAENHNLDFRLVDFGTLPFNDHSFDCVYTCAVLEHCYDVDKIVLDFDRLLKPGGLLVLATPNLLSPFTRLAFVWKKVTGKRKRYHLYGSPSFLFKSVWYSFKKGLTNKADLIYVEPNYDGFTESDEDVTFLSNHFDLTCLLKPLNYKILELARGGSPAGKFVANVFPKLSGEVLIVAKKASGSKTPGSRKS